ncbi:MAG: type IX secretion system membrane protein PorP/SprF, partial [Cytophagia bacterium]
MKHFLQFLVLGLCVFSIVKGQNIPLTQYENANFMYNPAMMNILPTTKIQLQHRNQNMAIRGSFQSSSFSVEHAFWQRNRIKKLADTLQKKDYSRYIRGGFGFTFITENQLNLLRNTGFLMRYNHIFNIFKDIKLSMGVQGGFLQKRVGLDNIITDNQINTGTFAQGSSTNEIIDNNQINHFTMSAGSFLYQLNNKNQYKYFLGVGIIHANRPKTNILSNNQSNLPSLTTLQAGYRVTLNNNLSLMPNTRLIFENDWQQIQIGTSIDYNINAENPFLMSFLMWYNSNKSINMGLQMQKNDFNFTFTYDLPMNAPERNRFMSNSGAWELNITYKINRKMKIFPVKKDEILDTLSKKETENKENIVKNEEKNIQNNKNLAKKEIENKENIVKNEEKNIQNNENLAKKETENKENMVKNEEKNIQSNQNLSKKETENKESSVKNEEKNIQNLSKKETENK